MEHSDHSEHRQDGVGPAMHEGHRETGPKDDDHTGHYAHMAADFRKLQAIIRRSLEAAVDKNATNEAVISGAAGRIAFRVIRTDEEQMIAETVCRVLGLQGVKEMGHEDEED